MIDTLFEQILFENDAVNQKNSALAAAQANAKQAGKDAKQAQGNADVIKSLAEQLGLKEGETYKPEDVIAAIKNKLSEKEDFLEEFSKNKNFCELLGMKAEDISKLKDAPSLTQQTEEGAEGGENAEAGADADLSKLNCNSAPDDKKENWNAILAALKKALGVPEAGAENGAEQTQGGSK